VTTRTVRPTAPAARPTPRARRVNLGPGRISAEVRRTRLKTRSDCRPPPSRVQERCKRAPATESFRIWARYRACRPAHTQFWPLFYTCSPLFACSARAGVSANPAYTPSGPVSRNSGYTALDVPSDKPTSAHDGLVHLCVSTRFLSQMHLCSDIHISHRGQKCAALAYNSGPIARAQWSSVI